MSIDGQCEDCFKRIMSIDKDLRDDFMEWANNFSIKTQIIWNIVPAWIKVL